MPNSFPPLLSSPNPTRRRFLTLAALTPALSLFPETSVANEFWNLPRTLWLRRQTKSGTEEVQNVYWTGDQIDQVGYRRICTLLRDVHSDQAVQMDFILLDILRGIQGWFEAYNIFKPIIITSGYRTSATNEATEGSARNSMHLYGKAVDFRIEGVPTEYLVRLGLYLSGGGVGYYQSRGFVHVDSGKLRFWRG